MAASGEVGSRTTPPREAEMLPAAGWRVRAGAAAGRWGSVVLLSAPGRGVGDTWRQDARGALAIVIPAGAVLLSVAQS
jgi:hypothetical protein